VTFDRDRIRALAWIAAAIVVAFLAARTIASGGDEPGSVTVEPVPAASAEGGAPAGALAVQVAGEVRRPGVYRLPPGARVYEAVEQAGGLTRRADQAGVNLVARVSDGQQVVVPRRGTAAAGVGGSAGSGGAAGAGGTGTGAPGSGAPKVSLGTATPEQLDAIDGIGPTLARRIVEYRQKNGGFSSVAQLRQIDGIGEKRFEALREAVTP
jgi:competence protein ComEA